MEVGRMTVEEVEEERPQAVSGGGEKRLVVLAVVSGFRLSGETKRGEYCIAWME
jgi:hypothetical protein